MIGKIITRIGDRIFDAVFKNTIFGTGVSIAPKAYETLLSTKFQQQNN